MNPPMFIAALYAKDNAGIEKRCSLQIRTTNSVIIPSPITPNVWILTSATTAVSTGIMLICLEDASRLIKHRHTSMSFDYHQLAALHLNISTHHHAMKSMSLLSTYLSTQPTQHYKYLIPRIQNMAMSKGSLEWDPALPLSQHTISSN